MITTELIDCYLYCKQKAYLMLTTQHQDQPELESHQQMVAKYLIHQFADTHKSQVIADRPLAELRRKEFLNLSAPAYLQAPSLRFSNYDLTLDFLEIHPLTKGTSKLICTPVKASPYHKISKHDRLSLCITAVLLQQHNPRVQTPRCKVLYGTNTTISKFALKPHTRSARLSLRDLSSMVEPLMEPRYYKNEHCQVCRYRDMCSRALASKDDLSLLGPLRPKEIDKLNNRGIFTIHQFSYTFRPRKNRKNATQPGRPQPALKALSLREQETHILDIPNLPNAATEVFVDFEGLPDERFVYLIGMIIRENGKESQTSFWADSIDDADGIMLEFLDKLRRLDNFTMYHYGSFETRALRRFDRRTKRSHSRELELVLERSFNVLSVLSLNVYPPTYTNQLKEIARFLGFKWSNEELFGLESVFLRQEWEIKGNKRHKKRLVRYNIEDCVALKIVKDWLSDIRTKADTKEPADWKNAFDIQATSYHKWGKARFESKDFEAVNKCAYFDYQRSKVYLRTSKAVGKALRRERGSKSRTNRIDRRLVTPEKCPNCANDRITVASENLRRRRILDLRFMRNGVKKWVVEVSGKRFKCLSCESMFDFPMYGHNLLVWCLNQHVTYGISFEKVGKMLLENFNIEVPKYKLFYLKSDLVGNYRETAKSILRCAVGGAVIHIDETSAPTRDAPSSYVWVVASMDSVFYILRPNREAGFLKDLLEGFSGVLISDFYRGYESLPYRQQKCLIHLIRDLNGDFHKNQLNSELRDIVIRFGSLLRTIIATIDRYGLRKRHLNKHHKDVNRFHKWLAKEEFETDIAVQYQRRLIRCRDGCFEFLNHDGVPWNNNNAENAIKPFAKYREMAGNLITRKGLEDYLVLLSIQQTCKYRGIGFLDFLKSGNTILDV